MPDNLAINSQIIRATTSGYESDYLTTDDQIEGIELTLEILQKCGFKEQENNIGNDSFIDNRTFVFYTKDIPVEIALTPSGVFNIYHDNGDDTYYSYKGIELKYLHQLQNIVFTNTGEELTYTP